MKRNQFSYFVCIGFLGGLVTFVACSPESNGLVGRAYHNTTAHYNAYYLSREKVKEIEAAVFESRQDDYNQLLEVVLPMDSNVAKAQEQLTEYAVEKASIAVQRHKNSKWADDSYLLIAKSRFYQMDFENAFKTYKYVNSNSKNKEARHAALIGLFRLYMESGEYDNAKSVINFIKKEKISKIDLAEFYLIRAQMHKEQEEWLQTVGTLALATPLLKKDEAKARTQFIMGQLYEQLNNPGEAYKRFRRVLKNNPTYELSFYARLHMLQNVPLKKKDEGEKMLAKFRKMLRDEKNVDYKDKIYYQMGLFESRRGDHTKAIAYLQKSIQVSTNDALQKAYSYLKAGEIYYENLQQYELAKAYYDSTMQTLPPTARNYDAIAKRQKVLDNFVTQIVTIQTEDSLQRLAKMDTTSLNNYLDELFAREEAQQAAQQKAQARANRGRSSEPDFSNAFDTTSVTRAQPAANSNPNQEGGGSGARWYFYNTAALSQGRTAFTRKWGNRKLEDNWRRSAKEINIEEQPEGNQPNPDSVAIASNEVITVGQQRQQRKEQVKSNLPYSPEALAESNKRVEEAYYSLGKIYNLELEELENADSTFGQLLTRFPKTEHEPEVLYFLYLINKELVEPEKQDTYKKRLLANYPNSTYAGIIGNPNYVRDGNLADMQANEAYRNAYQSYQVGNYEDASGQITEAMQTLAKGVLQEKFALLNALIVGRTQNKEAFKKALSEFIEKHPQSELVPYAQNLLKNSENFARNDK